eukprot:357018-Chlamydomonas_euryale.AAC.2
MHLPPLQLPRPPLLPPPQPSPPLPVPPLLPASHAPASRNVLTLRQPSGTAFSNASCSSSRLKSDGDGAAHGGGTRLVSRLPRPAGSRPACGCSQPVPRIMLTARPQPLRPSESGALGPACAAGGGDASLATSWQPAFESASICSTSLEARPNAHRAPSSAAPAASDSAALITCRLAPPDTLTGTLAEPPRPPRKPTTAVALAPDTSAAAADTGCMAAAPAYLPRRSAPPSSPPPAARRPPAAPPPSAPASAPPPAAPVPSTASAAAPPLPPATQAAPSPPATQAAPSPPATYAALPKEPPASHATPLLPSRAHAAASAVHKTPTGGALAAKSSLASHKPASLRVNSPGGRPCRRNGPPAGSSPVAAPDVDSRLLGVPPTRGLVCWTPVVDRLSARVSEYPNATELDWRERSRPAWEQRRDAIERGDAYNAPALERRIRLLRTWGTWM